jgi:hypothetical protein
MNELRPLTIGTSSIVFDGPVYTDRLACISEKRKWFSKKPNLFQGCKYLEVPTRHFSSIINLVDYSLVDTSPCINISMKYNVVKHTTDCYGPDHVELKNTDNLTIALLELSRSPHNKLYIDLNFDGWNMHYWDIDHKINLSELPNMDKAGMIVHSGVGRTWVFLDIFTKGLDLYRTEAFRNISKIDKAWLHKISGKNRVRGYRKENSTLPTLADVFNEDKMSLEFKSFITLFMQHWKNI